MQVLESSEKITPKSVLRHRPIGDSKPPVGKRSIVTTATPPVVQRASRPRPADNQDDVTEWQRAEQDDEEKNTQQPPSQKNQTITRHPSTLSRPVPTTPHPRATLTKPGPMQQAHPLLYLGVGMLAMLFLWTVLSSVFGWFSTAIDDARYGRPRTYQTDQWVGHNEQAGSPSHFIAINLNRRVEVIELPGGDASHAHVYLGPQLYGSNDDLVPVTLTFLDVNGDHKPDMIVNFQGSRIVFINDQGSFRSLQPSERHQVEQFLQHAKP